MKKKRHAKVYIISDDNLRKVIEPVEEMEYSLALDAIRAKCFSSISLANVATDDKGNDWEMNEALTKAMIQTCDVVAVIGGEVTPEMQKEIAMATSLGKKICVSNLIRDEVKKMNVPVSAESLVAVCKKVLQEEI